MGEDKNYFDRIFWDVEPRLGSMVWPRMARFEEVDGYFSDEIVQTQS